MLAKACACLALLLSLWDTTLAQPLAIFEFFDAPYTVAEDVPGGVVTVTVQMADISSTLTTSPIDVAIHTDLSSSYYDYYDYYYYQYLDRAKESLDYVGVRTTVTFDVGSGPGTQRMVNISIIDDNWAEYEEIFNVIGSVSSVDAAFIGGSNQATTNVTIISEEDCFSPSYFECDGSCLYFTQVCNGRPYCDDGSDEICDCNGLNSAHHDRYYNQHVCDDGQCILRYSSSVNLQCDRNTDCRNGSDERDCFLDDISMERVSVGLAIFLSLLSALMVSWLLTLVICCCVPQCSFYQAYRGTKKRQSTPAEESVDSGDNTVTGPGDT